MIKRTTILLIDHDVRVREAVGQALTVENYRVVPARNQQEALRQLNTEIPEQPIDVVLLDLNPPHESAWDTVQHLKALRPGMPVIAMTGRLEQEPTIHRPTVHAIMEKPFDLRSLIRLLEALPRTRSFV